MYTEQTLVYNELSDEVDGYVNFHDRKQLFAAGMVGCYYLRGMRSGQEIPLCYELTLHGCTAEDLKCSFLNVITYCKTNFTKFI